MSEHLFHFLTPLFSPYYRGKQKLSLMMFSTVKGENYLPAPVQGEGWQEDGSIK